MCRVLLAMLLCVGCTDEEPAGDITVRLSVKDGLFKDDAMVRVSLYSADQLAIQEAISGCSPVIGSDGTTDNRWDCDGTITPGPTPQNLTVAMADAVEGVTIIAEGFALDDDYEVVVSGSDGCNTGIHIAQGVVARSNRVKVKAAIFTERHCDAPVPVASVTASTAAPAADPEPEPVGTVGQVEVKSTSAVRVLLDGQPMRYKLARSAYISSSVSPGTHLLEVQNGMGKVVSSTSISVKSGMRTRYQYAIRGKSLTALSSTPAN